MVVELPSAAAVARNRVEKAQLLTLTSRIFDKFVTRITAAQQIPASITIVAIEEDWRDDHEVSVRCCIRHVTCFRCKFGTGTRAGDPSDLAIDSRRCRSRPQCGVVLYLGLRALLPGKDSVLVSVSRIAGARLDLRTELRV